MKKYILLFLLCLPVVMQAQVDKKYLEGGVPVIDGKVTFSTKIEAKGLTQQQIYDSVLEWANQRFQPTDDMNARVLYTQPETGSIAIGGEEYIVFASTALSLDRARIYYHFIIECTQDNCELTMTRIHYLYDENRNGGQKYQAEEWITDKYGLNKSKTKLALVSGKFRKKTIDYKDELFAEAQKVINNQVVTLLNKQGYVTPQIVTNQPVQPIVSEVSPTVVTPTQPVEKPATPAQISKDDLIQKAVRMTITAGNDEQFDINKEAWGGFGEFFNKKATFCLIDTQKTMGNMLMSQAQEYTISFFLANSSEPCVVIKCKKLMQQTMSGKEAKNMSPNCVEDKSYNMYVGEIME